MNDESIFNGEKIRAFIQKNTGYLIAAIVAAIYVATSVLTMDESGKTLSSIIYDGAASFFVGMVLTRIFSIQGIMRGNDDVLVKESIKSHEEQVIRIAPYIDKLNDWCDKQTAEALKRERTKRLAVHGMRYADYFDEDGVAIKTLEDIDGKPQINRRMEKSRMRCYKRAINLKISPLLASSLINGGEKSEDPFDFGPTISEYEKYSMKREGITKILMACIFGYYTVTTIQDFSASDLIWKLFQVGLFCASGVVQSYKSHLFMLNGYRKRITFCTGKLCEFEVYESERRKEINNKEETDNVGH